MAMREQVFQKQSQVTLQDLLEKIEHHRVEQMMLLEQIQEHLPEGFQLIQADDAKTTC